MSAFTMAQITRNYEKNVAPTRPQLSTKTSDASWDSQSTAPTLAGSETASVKGASSQAEKQSTSRKVWEKIKKAAKEHHESVNLAYVAHYDPGTVKNIHIK